MQFQKRELQIKDQIKINKIDYDYRVKFFKMFSEETADIKLNDISTS